MSRLRDWYDAHDGEVSRRDALRMLWHRWRMNRAQFAEDWDRHYDAIVGILRRHPNNEPELERWAAYRTECERLATLDEVQ